MNRRSFFDSLGKLTLAGSTFNILPGAGRIWKATANVNMLIQTNVLMLNPDWINAEFDIYFGSIVNTEDSTPSLNPNKPTK